MVEAAAEEVEGDPRLAEELEGKFDIIWSPKRSLYCSNTMYIILSLPKVALLTFSNGFSICNLTGFHLRSD